MDFIDNIRYKETKSKLNYYNYRRQLQLRNMFKRYFCIKQHDLKDCGCACLATISKQYGLKISISKIREVSGTDKQGTSAYGIIKAAEQIGFTAKGVRVNKPEDIFSEFPLPAIAHVIINNYK